MTAERTTASSQRRSADEKQVQGQPVQRAKPTSATPPKVVAVSPAQLRAQADAERAAKASRVPPSPKEPARERDVVEKGPQEKR